MQDSFSVIQKTIQEFNQNVFAPVGLHVSLLKECSDSIPLLCDWLYEEWRPFDPTLSRTRLLQVFQERAHSTQIPFTLVALRKDKPVGVITLKYKDDDDLKEFADGSPWLGSLHVVAQERGRGLGTELLSLVKTIATRLAHPRILLYTSKPDKVGWYQERGAEVIGSNSFHQHTVTVLQLLL